MGYTTDFIGSFQLNKPLTKKQFDYINLFSETRRMKRDVTKLMEIYKGKGGYPGRTANKNTPLEIYGQEGEYFVGGGGNAGQDRDDSIIDYNCPPGKPTWEERKNVPFNESWEEEQKLIAEGKCQPGLWCQWIVEDGEDNQKLIWDGGEKFYEYIAWLKYMIKHFFEPWKVKLNGEVEWEGEDSEDRGKIEVKNNVVEIYVAKTTYTKA